MGEKELSRRTVLGAVAGTGAFGSAIGGSAALLRSETRIEETTVAAGSLSIDTCWRDGRRCAGPLEISVGPEDSRGSRTLEYSLPEDGNPAYVWIRTSCPENACGLYERLSVVLRDGACGRGPSTVVASGPLCRVLKELRSGALLAEGRPVVAGETRCVELGWDLVEPLESDDSIESLTVELYATQARNVGDVEATNPWRGHACPVNCADTVDCDDGGDGTDISWVAFCATPGTTLTDDDLEFSVDGDRLVLGHAPEAVETVLLKGGQYLDVFEDPGTAGTFRTGTGETYEQQGPGFPGTEPERSNPEPCPGACGLKYEVRQDGSLAVSSRGCDE